MKNIEMQATSDFYRFVNFRKDAKVLFNLKQENILVNNYISTDAPWLE